MVQRSVSAPDLFIIYIHDLLAAIHSTYVEMNLFADDGPPSLFSASPLSLSCCIRN